MLNKREKNPDLKSHTLFFRRHNQTLLKLYQSLKIKNETTILFGLTCSYRRIPHAHSTIQRYVYMERHNCLKDDMNL